MKSNPQAQEKPRLVAKSALFFGSGTLSSRILGLIRDILLISALPLDVKDAWLAAYKLPNFFRRMLGEGGLSASFIPIFVETHRQGDKKDTAALVNGVFTLLFSISSLICGIAIALMPQLVSWWLSGKGFSAVPGKVELTITLARVMFSFLLCMSMFAYFMALLNGIKKFALTGFAPVLFNASIIAALLLFADAPNLGLHAAYGVLVGGIFQAAILLPPVAANGLLPRFSFRHIFTPQVKRVLQRFVPTLLGLGVVQLMGVINLAFASRLDPGAVTYIYMGDRLLELPLSLIAVSIGTALLPTLSDYWSEGRKDLFSQSVLRHLQLYLFLAIPAAVGLWVLGDRIVSVLFVRGEFTFDEVPLVAQILKAYCLLLLAAGSLRIFNQAFYAAQDTLTPALISSFGLIVHVLMAPLWMQLWGVVGLCFSTALTALINLKIASILVHRRYHLIGKRKFVFDFTKYALAASIMGGAIFYAQSYFSQAQRGLEQAAVLFGIIALGGGVYFAMAFILGIDEARLVTSKIRQRFTKVR